MFFSNPPIKNYENRTVWVVGASSGIGFELAKKLKKINANLILSARRIGILKDYFPENLTIRLDVTDEKSVKGFFDYVRKENLNIDTVFWCPAIYSPMNAYNFSYQEAEKIMKVNFLSIFLPFSKMTKLWINKEINSKNSIHWIWISSVAGYRGLPGSPAYGPSKAAMNNFAEASYIELKPYNIHITLVCPGFVETRLTRKNNFKMPFLMKPENAANKIFKGLSKGNFEIHFPLIFTFWLKLFKILPNKIYFLIAKKFFKNDL